MHNDVLGPKFKKEEKKEKKNGQKKRKSLGYQLYVHTDVLGPKQKKREKKKRGNRYETSCTCTCKWKQWIYYITAINRLVRLRRVGLYSVPYRRLYPRHFRSMYEEMC